MADEHELELDEQDLLQSALETSFTAPPDLRRQSTHEPPSSARPSSAGEAAPAAPVTENASHAVLAEDAPTPAEAAAFKAEYDAQQAAFRELSAEQRDRAERERARWEHVRAEEAAQGVDSRVPLGADAGPPTLASSPTTTTAARAGTSLDGHGSWVSVQDAVSASESSIPPTIDDTPASPSPADARALVAGESEGPPASSAHATPSTLATTDEPAAHGHARHDASSEHSGSDIPSSLTSSFPSSFTMETPPSPSHNGAAPAAGHDGAHGQHHHLADDGGHASRAPVPLPPPFGGAAHDAATRKQDAKDGAPPPPPLTVTPLIFDTELPASTRTYALLASLGINLLLPFVNGVMLGFGEIFAKEVVGVWLGWTRPGSSVANLGLGKAGSKKK